jgi:hypothetical protein
VRSPHDGRLHRVLKLALVALQHLCGLLVQRIFRVGVLRWPQPQSKADPCAPTVQTRL